MSHSSKPVTLIVVASMLAVLAAPAYARQGLDLRSPDARDNVATYQQPAPVDLRSPDAQDGAGMYQQRVVPASDEGGSGLPPFALIAALGVASGLTLVALRRHHRQTRPTVSA
jgi:hypothetical protein